MVISGIIFEKLISMFLIILFGYFLAKTDVLDNNGSQQLVKMLNKYVIPITIIMAFQQEFSQQQFINLGWALLGAVLLHLIRIPLAHFMGWRGNKIDRHSIIFSNSGFLGIPITLAILGYEGVFYLSLFIVVSSILRWTYGVHTLSEGKENITLKSAFINPASIGLYIGLALYLLEIQLPTILASSMDSIVGLNSPLGMIILGGYLARGSLKAIFNSKQAYWTTFMRLIFTPLIGLVVIWLLPIEDPYVLLVLAITNCTPTAVNTALFSQLYGGDYEYGARLVILTTMMSLITMPVMLFLSNAVLHIY